MHVHLIGTVAECCGFVHGMRECRSTDGAFLGGLDLGDPTGVRVHIQTTRPIPDALGRPS